MKTIRINLRANVTKLVHYLPALRKAAAIMGCLFACATAQAINITALNTGAGLYGANFGAVVVDPHWTISLLSTDPLGQTPPGGIPAGPAYLVPNSTVANVDPFSTHWLPNSAASCWLSYSTPTSMAPDNTGGTYRYQLSFTANNSGVIGINWLSDDSDVLSVNGSSLGSNAAYYGAWLPTPVSLAVTAGSTYTVDLDVYNAPQGPLLNPTAGRVEFSGNVDVSLAVPDTASTVILLLIALGSLALFGKTPNAQSVLASIK